MEVDYIIIGQGICGTFLSWYLLQQNKKVFIFDMPVNGSSSMVASGLINPVTGRRIVTTWMIEELLPFARHAYKNLGAQLGATIARASNILDFHPTQQMKDAFTARQAEGNLYLKTPDNEDAWVQYFNYHYGIGEIDQCMVIDLQTMLAAWRQELKKSELLSEQAFLWEDCKISEDTIQYQNITASKVICCDGASGLTNPYFNKLPFSNVKGEALIASIPGLPRNFVYKEGITIVPWKDHLFWIGSSYQWDYKDLEPTEQFRAGVENKLKRWLKCDYTISDHWASARPASLERRPFVGLHPQYPSIGIFNGMGSKGCSLTPYFAKQFANVLSGNGSLLPAVDVQRYKKLLLK